MISRNRIVRLIGPILVAVVFGLSAWQTAAWVRDRAVSDLVDAGRRQLELYVTHLKGQLEKYEYLPELISTNRRLVELLSGPPDSERITALNRYLEDINLVSDASDTYVMDATGVTIAASNWDSERPFVGRDFSYRPYFQEALKGYLGRYFALGTTSGKRGYYFAYPVRAEDRILGAVVIKVDMGAIEAQWKGQTHEVLVTDPDGVVFVTSRPDWRFRTLEPLSAEVRELVLASRRYPGEDLTPLPVTRREVLDQQSTRLTVREEGANGERRKRDFLMQQRQMPAAGWTVHLLSSLAEANRRVLDALAILSAAYLVLILLVLVLRQRYRRRLEAIRCEERARTILKAAHDDLERRVNERTLELLSANDRLTLEIEERWRAEQELRRTQHELIQAAKLATLGQMSAGINHEINQPLAAMRAYADNTKALLERDRLAEARWNLEQIADLVDRMAQIGTQLKIFSRKSTGHVGPVSLGVVIGRAEAIVTPRRRRVDASLEQVLPDTGLWVRADEVKLQQVLVNLIGNALQAVEGLSERLVRISGELRGDKVAICVDDSGSGIADEHIGKVFDPFFTTKEASEGLGLGLTISARIIEDLDGCLSVSSSTLGGARFEILLPSAAPEPEPVRIVRSTLRQKR